MNSLSQPTEQSGVNSVIDTQSNAGLYRTHFKRLLDILFVILVAPAIAPVIFVLWLFARRDGGPGFYSQLRVGKNGKLFRIWKIRSMLVNSEELLKNHLAENPEAAREWAENFKLKDDPRISAFGKFIRTTSLDELPQFLNVMYGEMSVVGPRPVVEAELERYGSNVAYYLNQTPGVTGLWQVSGRNDISYDERVQMDVKYHKESSLAVDLEIIFKTAFSVIHGEGK